MAGGDEKESVLSCGLGIGRQPDFLGQVQSGAQLLREHKDRSFGYHLGQGSLGLGKVDEEVDA
ncbi:MAG TPA: hypothetical protein VNC61_05265 [Acidimicrobiales bacterium]|nr:hypothetical protein [Acidimicrobiales bacterium]